MLPPSLVAMQPRNADDRPFELRNDDQVVLSEAFWEPLQLLNAMRALVQLPPLVEHDFNRYLKKPKLEEFLRSLGVRFQCEEFSSVYYLGSRFLRELATDASAWPEP